MKIWADILGWIGMVVIVTAYFLVSFKKMEAANPAYQAMNLIGSVAVGVNVFYQQAWPAVALEVVWGLIAIIALTRK